MNDSGDATTGSLFLTVDEVLAEHERLLAAQTDRDDVEQVRSFVDRLTESGAYFDEAFERKALQGTLDYWTSELAKRATDLDSTASRRRSIREFNPEALKALQQDFENPFGQVAELLGSLGPDDRHSAAAVLRLITDTAKTQNLRFQDGLLKEMISQVCGDSERDPAAQVNRDREDATLLEFCLWHLFEDPQTRLGNKIYRPERSGNKDERINFFSCKVYLVRKADELFVALDRPVAVLDALMSMGSDTDGMQRPRSVLGWIASKPKALVLAVQTWLRSARWQTRTFELYGKQGLNLLAFLQASRLAFKEGRKWRIVHPALARWDPLKERRWKATERQKLLALSFTALVVALATSLAWIVWYQLWTNVALNHLAKAQTSADAKDRLAEGVAGLWASNRSMGSDNSYAIQVANDAIGAVIGERAKDGRGALEDLKPYPDLPRIDCEQIQALGAGYIYSVTVPDLSAKFPTLDACPLFTVNLAGTRLAAAWESEGHVTVKVFEIPATFRLASGDNGTLLEADLKREKGAAPRLNDLHELELDPPLNTAAATLTKKCKDRALRFSEDDGIVTFECLYSADERTSSVQWIAATIKDTRSSSNLPSQADVAGVGKVIADTNSTLLPCSRSSFESLPQTSRVTSVFLGTRTGSMSSFVTVRGDGYVQIWHAGREPDAPCLSAQFRSDFVRVATGGRPVTLDVQDRAGISPMYAIYALSPSPVVRVYEQRHAKQARLLMEHYPPAGVGTPVGIRFTPNARCLQIRARRRNLGQLVSVDYYLILDPSRLLTVGRALESDLQSKTPATDGTIPKYHDAIQKQCYGT